MNSFCRTCGRPTATKADMDAYFGRTYCRSQGDCECPICAKVCWAGSDGTCGNKVQAQAERGAEGK